MLDIGWSEMLVIGAVALVVIGPKDLPRVLYEMGKWAGKARHMVGELRSGFDAMVREAELDEMHKQFKSATDLGVEFKLDGPSSSGSSSSGEMGPHLPADSTLADPATAEAAALPVAEAEAEQAAPAVRHLW